MNAADRSSDTAEPLSAQADAAGSDTAAADPVAVLATGDETLAAMKPANAAGTAGTGASTASVPVRPATTDTGAATVKARKTDAVPNDDDDDDDTEPAAGTQTNNPPLPATTPDTQPVLLPARMAAASGQTDTGMATKEANAGGKAAHAVATGSGATDATAQTQLVTQSVAALIPDPSQAAAVSTQPQAQTGLSLSPMQTTTLASGAAGDLSTTDGTATSGTSAATQVSGPVVTLMQSTNGASSMAISLHPKELGAVKISLDRDAGGAVRVVVAATEPSTLRSLISDQSQLHAALDAASVPAGDRQISFELAGGQTGGDGAGSQSAQAGTGDDGQRGSGQTRQQDWGSGGSGAGGEELSTAMPFQIPARTGTYRAGVNITA